MKQTENQFRQVIEGCKQVFLNKARDYGTSWLVMRLPSITDQLFIKARRIRTLEDTQENRVGEGVENEWIGIVNYCVMALMLIQYQGTEVVRFDTHFLDQETLSKNFDDRVRQAHELLQVKNHDYGEAWRDMRPSSFTDLVLMKIMRIKQMEDDRNPDQDLVESIYLDMLNYAAFALIRIQEGR